MSTPFDDWADIYDPVHSNRTADILFYVDLAKSTGGSVLELACGTGRVAIPIARAGVDIVGMDLSPAMLRTARRNLKAAGELPGTLTLKRGDMRDFRLGQRFSLVTIPFNTFLLLLSVAEQRQALESIHRHLEPGGRLALDIFVPNLERLVREDASLYHQGDVTDPASGRRFVLWDQTTYDNHHQMLHARIIIEELDQRGRVIQKLHRIWQMRYVYRYEMQHLLEVCGFQVEELYGDFQEGEFDTDSTQMVWVAGRV